MAIDKEAFKRSAQTKPSFPFKQGAAALARHDLGPLETWTQVGANPTNCLYRATGPNGIFFVKIKFRATSSLIRPGPSLAVEADLAAFLRANTTLPLPPICLFDEDSDIFGHSFLVSAALPDLSAAS